MDNSTVNLSGMYLNIAFLEKRYKYRFIVSQILIQDTVLKMYLGTRYIFRIIVTYLDTCISDSTQHCPLLGGFHPAAAAAAAAVGDSVSSAWSNVGVVGQQMTSINCDLQDAAAADSTSYLAWYSQRLMDSCNLR